MMFPLTGALKTPTSRAFIGASVIALTMLGASCTGAGDVPPLGHTVQALTATQCDYFAVDGTTRICHATGSAREPYVVLNVAETACVEGHVRHAHDYVAVNDPTCGGQGCLPVNAPCDAALGCCSGMECRGGACQPTDRCLGVTCAAGDQCHVVSCDPATGACRNEPKVNGFDCDDGNACTQLDTCQAGVCTGASVTCAASDQCHSAGVCDPANGTCSDPLAPNGTVCDDQDARTTGDRCTGSLCAGVIATTQVSAGQDHTCAISASGKLYCWGLNGFGQLGDGTRTQRLTPVQVGTATDWQSVTVGRDHTCAIAAGRLYCWGDNYTGQLGDGTTTQRLTPVQVGTATDWQSVSAGSSSNCAIAAGRLYCWGYAYSGVLGDGSLYQWPNPPQLTPTQVGTATNWRSVAMSGSHTCGLAAGQLYCWGLNDFGQLGDGTTTWRSTPVQVGTATDWQSVTVNGMHTCGFLSGRLHCWGNNSYGQLGDGTTTHRLTPVLVSTTADWQSVAQGSGHTCAISTSRRLYCWGSNSSGKLGDGNTSVQRSTPFQVGTATDWQSAELGGHSCAIASGRLYCWGSNASGQLGDGSTTNRWTPMQVNTGANW